MTPRAEEKFCNGRNLNSVFLLTCFVYSVADWCHTKSKMTLRKTSRLIAIKFDLQFKAKILIQEQAALIEIEMRKHVLRLQKASLFQRQ